MNSDMPVFRVDRPLALADLMAELDAPCRRTGSENPTIRTVAALSSDQPCDLAFCRHDGLQAQQAIATSRARVVICRQAPDASGNRVFLEVDDPRGWFIRALELLMTGPSKPSRHPSAMVDPAADVAADVDVEAGAVIKAGARVGAGCRIGAGAIISGAARLDAGCRIGAHSIIGSEGLSFHRHPDQPDRYFPHLGQVVIGAGTVVGTHCSIVRGILENTRIGPNAQIGNQVNIGHNCRLGADVFISSGTVLAGGCHVGDRARLAAGVTVTAHGRIGQDAHVGLGSVVVKPVADGRRVFGNPARPLPTMKDF